MIKFNVSQDSTISCTFLCQINILKKVANNNFNVRVAKGDQLEMLKENEAGNDARGGGDGWNYFTSNQFALMSVCWLDAVVGCSQV